MIDALVVRLGDTDDTVAEVAAFALGETGTPDSPPPPAHVVDALETMATSHEVHLCREAAVAALGALGVGRATILAALGDRATVRRRAVIALAPFEGPDVDAALERALDDRDWQVRQAAEDLLTITADGERAVEADAGTADETET
ncbi:MAG: HEAT repeat domain-containing protein [Acidimicrobiales bacterium]